MRGIISVLYEQKNALLAKSKIPVKNYCLPKVQFMKYENYALYMGAIIYHMNHLQKRKELETCK
jgi:hypothetical protein